MDDIKLRPVTYSDARFLYTLLGDRAPEANISHKAMPTFDQHRAFILTHPYSVWYVIQNYTGPIGAVYLTKADEVGLFLLQTWQGLGIGKTAFGLLKQANPRPRYLANVAPGNEASQAFFRGQGFKLIQNTYELVGVK